MTNNVLSCILVASLFSCIGCSSTNVVSSSPNADPSFNTFNDEADDRWATIVLKDGKELEADDIFASPDSTLFLDRNTDLLTVLPTHTINKVVLTDDFLGGLYGLGIGAALGGTMGAILGTSEDVDPAIAMFYLGLLGGGIGAVMGLAIGYDFEYQFQANSEQSQD